MNAAGYMLIDCATDLSYGPFEQVDRARDHAEGENIARWEIVSGDGTLVAWSRAQNPSEAGLKSA